jgi:1-acyl-sn-glycerol-3-phosphate acyltransferase
VLYNIWHGLFFIIATIFFRLRTHGRENIPRTGPVLLAPNHVSYFDPAIIGTAIWRKVNYAAKRELFDSPLFGWWLRSVQSFPISRDIMDRRALRTALNFLKNGKVVLMFPEGTRGDGQTLLEPRPGVGMLAYMAKAPVVPVYIKGTDKVYPKDAKMFRFKPITVYYGKPLDLDGYYSAPKYRGIYMDISQEIMKGIQELKDKHG